MSKSKDKTQQSTTTTGTTQQGTGQTSTTTQPTLTLKGHYVKHMDFRGPGLAQRPEGSVKTALTVNVTTTPTPSGDHEVVLALKAEIETEKNSVAVINMIYGAQYQLTNIQADQQDVVLKVEGPRLIFPYVQRIIADMTRDGNLSPLSLPSIDFASVYQASKKTS